MSFGKEPIIARYKSDAPHDVVKNWLRSRETIEFLGLWESFHNTGFKQVEFDLFRSQAGLNAFTMSPTKWIEGVNAIGIVSKAGRYGGTLCLSIYDNKTKRYVVIMASATD